MPETYYVKGVLGIYELNRTELFKDVFMWAYKRSALRYAAVRQSLGEPDAFRLQYREEIKAVIMKIIMQTMKKKEAIQTLKAQAEKLPPDDQAKFIEAVKTELIDMHEGNFARYRIMPSELKKWGAVWNS